MIISEEDIRAIVVDGDVEKLVSQAQVLGRRLKDDRLSTTQIRGIFGTMRQIESRWREDGLAAADAERVRRQCWHDLLLLQPKLAYQTQRHSTMRELKHVLTCGIPLVERDRRRFQNLMDYFEATLAYHVAAGGSTR